MTPSRSGINIGTVDRCVTPSCTMTNQHTGPAASASQNCRSFQKRMELELRSALSSLRVRLEARRWILMQISGSRILKDFDSIVVAPADCIAVVVCGPFAAKRAQQQPFLIDALIDQVGTDCSQALACQF